MPIIKSELITKLAAAMPMKPANATFITAYLAHITAITTR